MYMNTYTAILFGMVDILVFYMVLYMNVMLTIYSWTQMGV